jgi:deazaflavin-dependent oxidoreductase (nitroreductase family)
VPPRRSAARQRHVHLVAATMAELHVLTTMYVGERKHNPFINSAAGGRTLSALQLPFFTLRPPIGFGVLTTRGRRSGKTRRRCVRAICEDGKAYIVAIKGARTSWVKNIRANPDVRLRVRGGTCAGLARELRGMVETQTAMEAYCEKVNPFDYLECLMWRKGRPTRTKIKELHRAWFDHGTPLLVELAE